MEELVRGLDLGRDKGTLRGLGLRESEEPSEAWARASQRICLRLSLGRVREWLLLLEACLGMKQGGSGPIWNVLWAAQLFSFLGLGDLGFGLCFEKEPWVFYGISLGNLVYGT